MESQNVEYKQSCMDEYLKWICILVAVEQYRSSKVDELHFSVIR